MRALGGRDLLALVGFDLASGYRTSHGSCVQLWETAIRCFSRAAAAPLSSDLVPIATPSFRLSARPGHHQRRRGVQQRHVPIWARYAVQHALQRDRVGIGVAALQRLAADAGEARFLRRHLEGADVAVLEAATKVGPVRVISSRPSEPCTTQTDSAPRFFSTCASGCTHCRENTPTICRLTPAGLDSGPKQIEDRARGQFDAGRADVLHRGVVRWREHEADAGFLDAAADLFGLDVDLDPERCQHVGRARARGQRAVAVLGDRDAGAGDDERGAGRHVDRARAVAAGADDVDGVGRAPRPAASWRASPIPRR